MFFALKMAIHVVHHVTSASIHVTGEFLKSSGRIFREIKGGGVGGSDNFQPFSFPDIKKLNQ